MPNEQRDKSFATFAAAWCAGFIAHRGGLRDESPEDLAAWEKGLMADYDQWCGPLGRPPISEGMIERAAVAAFNRDTLDGHHKGGVWTWESIPEQGRCNYRLTVRAALEAHPAPASLPRQPRPTHPSGTDNRYSTSATSWSVPQLGHRMRNVSATLVHACLTVHSLQAGHWQTGGTGRRAALAGSVGARA